LIIKNSNNKFIDDESKKMEQDEVRERDEDEEEEKEKGNEDEDEEERKKERREDWKMIEVKENGNLRNHKTNDKIRKTSALDLIMEQEEMKKERINRKDYWLFPNIVVKVLNQTLKDGKYFKKKRCGSASH